MTRSVPGRSRSLLSRRVGVVALAVVTLSGGAVVALATTLASPAAAVSGTALINGDTVTGSAERRGDARDEPGIERHRRERQHVGLDVARPTSPQYIGADRRRSDVQGARAVCHVESSDLDVGGHGDRGWQHGRRQPGRVGLRCRCLPARHIRAPTKGSPTASRSQRRSHLHSVTRPASTSTRPATRSHSARTPRSSTR